MKQDILFRLESAVGALRTAEWRAATVAPPKVAEALERASEAERAMVKVMCEYILTLPVSRLP
jgi:hypothetical protein